MSAFASCLEPFIPLLTLAVVLATPGRLAVELDKPVLLAVEVDKLVGCLEVERLMDLSSSSVCNKTSILDLICSFILWTEEGERERRERERGGWVGRE